MITLLIKFLMSVGLAFVIPGDLIISRLSLPRFIRFVTATILGMILWAWQGFVFGYLGIRWASYLYLFASLSCWIGLNKGKIVHLKNLRVDWIVVVLIFVGTVIQSIPMAGNGLRYEKGMFFCCGDSKDNLMHLSYTQELVHRMPPMEPGMIDIPIRNYHYWPNLIVAELVRVFGLPVAATFFQFMLPFISLFLGLGAIAFAGSLNLNKSFGRWLLFFLYFGGDFIYELLILVGNIADFHKVASLEDGAKFLVNPPRAFALVATFVGLSLFIHWRKSGSKLAGIVSMIVLASTTGFKVYTALYFAIGFLFLGLFLLWKRKWWDISILLIFYILSLIIYLPTNRSAGGLYFVPLFIVHDFIVQPAFNLSRIELARYIFLAHGNILRIIEYNLIELVIFFLAVFGTKIIAFFQTRKTLASLGYEMSLVLGSGALVSLVLGLFYLQSSGGANSFNFIVIVWLHASIFAAASITYWQSKLPKYYSWIAGILLVFLTIPRVAVSTYENIKAYGSLGYLTITNQELAAYDYVKTHTAPTSRLAVDSRNELDFDTPYIAALTDRPTILSGIGEMDNHSNNPFKSDAKVHAVKNILFRSPDEKSLAYIAKELRLDYLVLWTDTELVATKASEFIQPVYKNNIISIQKIDHEKMDQFLKLHPEASQSAQILD